ncbi:hypothetical protein Q4R34_13745 [Morganella morganii]
MRKYWCPVCEKPVPADQLAVNVGDKVNIAVDYTRVTKFRATTRIVIRTGKITAIENDIAAVTYRSKVYRRLVAVLVPADAPGMITRALHGECECGSLPEGTTDD